MTEAARLRVILLSVFNHWFCARKWLREQIIWAF